MSMNINTNYPCDPRNYRKGRRDSIKYIVVHYVGATGSALANVKYYGGSDAGASAHYYVGHASEVGAIYQSVAPEDCAWHCGHDPGGVYYHPECRNDNAIGIEMCCHKDKNGVWYFDDITVDKTVELVRWLMDKYGIPLDRVIRHYDVTHKICPAPFVLDAGAWNRFKQRVAEVIDMDELRKLQEQVAALTEAVNRLSNPMVYNWIDSNMPEWARPYVQKAIDLGIIQGTGEGLNLTDEKIWMLVVILRAAGIMK